MNFLKSSTKYAVVFVAGGIIFNATSAISNAPSTQDVLTDALAAAIGKVNDRSALRESQELAKLPNILECQNLKWLENCSTINEQAKKNPNAPLRVTNAKGLEFNFQPGTPSAVIRLQLEQTPEAARAAVKYMDDTWGEYEKSASLYQVASWQTKQNNIKSIDEAQEEMKAVKDLDLKGLSLSVFVESTCNVCDRYLGILESLQDKYPQLNIRIFQLDQSKERFASKVTARGLRGRILTPDESNRLQQAGVRSWPISWVDHLPTKKRETLVGNRTLAQVENRLLAMTYQAAATVVAKKDN